MPKHRNTVYSRGLAHKHKTSDIRDDVSMTSAASKKTVIEPSSSKNINNIR